MTPPGCELLGHRWQNRPGRIFMHAAACSPPSLGKGVKCKYAGQHPEGDADQDLEVIVRRDN